MIGYFGGSQRTPDAWKYSQERIREIPAWLANARRSQHEATNDQDSLRDFICCVHLLFATCLASSLLQSRQKDDDVKRLWLGCDSLLHLAPTPGWTLGGQLSRQPEGFYLLRASAVCHLPGLLASPVETEGRWRQATLTGVWQPTPLGPDQDGLGNFICRAYLLFATCLVSVQTEWLGVWQPISPTPDAWVCRRERGRFCQTATLISAFAESPDEHLIVSCRRSWNTFWKIVGAYVLICL
jgi:hypothetical protein